MPRQRRWEPNRRLVHERERLVLGLARTLGERGELLLEQIGEPDLRAVASMTVDTAARAAELTQKLQMPLGTVKSWIRRGLMKLRGCLER